MLNTSTVVLPVVISPPKRWLPAQSMSTPARKPDPVSANGTPLIIVREPSEAMLNSATPPPAKPGRPTARYLPSGDTFIPAGAFPIATLDESESDPSAAMLKVSIALLAVTPANKNCPFDDAASEISLQPVAPVEYGDVVTEVKPPRLGSIANAAILWLPPFEA